MLLELQYLCHSYLSAVGPPLLACMKKNLYSIGMPFESYMHTLLIGNVQCGLSVDVQLLKKQDQPLP